MKFHGQKPRAYIQAVAECLILPLTRKKTCWASSNISRITLKPPVPATCVEHLNHQDAASSREKVQTPSTTFTQVFDQEGNVGLMKPEALIPEVCVRLVSFAVHWINWNPWIYFEELRIVKVRTKAQRKMFFIFAQSRKKDTVLGSVTQNRVCPLAI